MDIEIKHKEECPVCKNNEYFSCDVSSSDGYASLTNRHIGQINLNVCTKCGCVYVGKSDLDLYNRKRKYHKKQVYYIGETDMKGEIS